MPDSKYTVAIFLDISSDFDNVWFPAIIDKSVVPFLVKTVDSYLTDQEFVYYLLFGQTNNSQKAQGSVHEPTLWNPKS